MSKCVLSPDCKRLGFTRYNPKIGWITHHIDGDGKVGLSHHTWSPQLGEPVEIKLDDENLRFLQTQAVRDPYWSRGFELREIEILADEQTIMTINEGAE